MMKIYQLLLNYYGPQGWWPLHGQYSNSDFQQPKTKGEQWEIILGALLTQNTTWKNVEKVLHILRTKNSLQAQEIVLLPLHQLQGYIRSVGYFRQKAERLQQIARWFLASNQFSSLPVQDARNQLLELKGVGPETADSILLYAFRQPIFVVDAYTKRIFSRIGMVSKEASYVSIQQFFMKSLPADYRVYNEYHALIVQHAKQYCTKTPQCRSCPLQKICDFFQN